MTGARRGPRSRPRSRDAPGRRGARSRRSRRSPSRAPRPRARHAGAAASAGSPISLFRLPSLRSTTRRVASTSATCSFVDVFASEPVIPTTSGSNRVAPRAAAERSASPASATRTIVGATAVGEPRRRSRPAARPAGRRRRRARPRPRRSRPRGIGGRRSARPGARRRSRRVAPGASRPRRRRSWPVPRATSRPRVHAASWSGRIAVGGPPRRTAAPEVVSGVGPAEASARRGRSDTAVILARA